MSIIIVILTFIPKNYMIMFYRLPGFFCFGAPWTRGGPLVFMSKHLWIFVNIRQTAYYSFLFIIVDEKWLLCSMWCVASNSTYLSLCWDKLVSCGCIHISLFFATTAAVAVVVCTRFFFSVRRYAPNFWYSFGTYCEKGAVCKPILLKLNTLHPGGRGEWKKKSWQWEMSRTIANENTHQTDITLICLRLVAKQNPVLKAERC